MKSKKQDGISLRTIHFCLVVMTVLVFFLSIATTISLADSFENLTASSEEQIELRKAARELLDASDYLTERVQRFAVTGERRFMDEYFQEAFQVQRREEAISTMRAAHNGSAALNRLLDAMGYSVRLMGREYYVMRLVVEAQGITSYPEQIADVKLSTSDAALSSEDKMERAVLMSHDDVYYSKKDNIRADITKSLKELENYALDTDTAALDRLNGDMALLRFVLIVETLGIILTVWLTSRLSIHPILNAVERIQDDSPIPEVGGNEFRYLARAYNKMYEVYQSSLEHLSFKASHDDLTGAYNRAGYDLLLNSIDMNNTYMIMFDLDNFKGINDTYGHEMGDKVLQKLVNVLRSNFRADDYICRIGGDEFVVFMAHTTRQQHDMVALKAERINEQLADTQDGLPEISVSVGIVHGSEAKSTRELFKKTDAAMYQAKQLGKHTYVFD